MPQTDQMQQRPQPPSMAARWQSNEVGTVATGTPAGTDRAADAITRFAGSMLSIYLHPAWFVLWTVDNVAAPSRLDRASLLWGHGTASSAVPTPRPGHCPRTRTGRCRGPPADPTPLPGRVKGAWRPCGTACGGP